MADATVLGSQVWRVHLVAFCEWLGLVCVSLDGPVVEEAWGACWKEHVCPQMLEILSQSPSWL